MPAKRTGTVQPWIDAEGRKRYRARIRLADGARPWIPIDQDCDEEEARQIAADFQREEDETGAFLKARTEQTRRRAGVKGAPAPGETADAWFERYHSYAKELGQTDAGKKRDRWKKWISETPVRGGTMRFGELPIASVTRDDIEDVRDELDRAIEAWKRLGKSAGKKGRAIAGKTAMNAWSCLTSSFKAATSSKRRDLRALEGRPNPCLGVEPPGDRESRQIRRKTFLYPRESGELLSCEIVEIEWREVYAIALYTYLRPGELRVLTVGDVERPSRHVRVNKAWDYEEQRIKPPKTRNGVRRVPIEPALDPLLERLCRDRKPTDLLVPCLAAFGEDHLAELWRKHLLVAGIDREELHHSTRTHVQSNFRSCRDSGLTWLALAGVDVTKIMRRAGHDHVQTTMGYVKLAEDLTGDLGTPFAPLPSSLIEPSVYGTVHEARKSSDLLCRRRESKPSSAHEAAEKPTFGDDGDGSDRRASPRSHVEPNPVDQSVDRSVDQSRAVDRSPADPLAGALAKAIGEAAAAGRFDVVAQLAKELEARRLALAGNVVPLDVERGRRKHGR